MKNYYIKKTRILKLNIPTEFNEETIEIGVPVTRREAKKNGLNNVGEAIVPSPYYGKQCIKNANGYFYIDKTKPKEYRYVSTNWIHPYGNRHVAEIPVDIMRWCYPREFVLPLEIKLKLVKECEDLYIIADLTDNIRKNHLKEAINIVLEVFGECYIFANAISMDSKIIETLSWEVLPPGEMPSRHNNNRSIINEIGYEYSQFRLQSIEEYKFEQMAQGINGFQGYYVYVATDCCVLESAKYGNATYIIPKNNWKALSKKTKKELFDENKVLAKLIHNANWLNSLRNSFEKFGIEKEEEDYKNVK